MNGRFCFAFLVGIVWGGCASSDTYSHIPPEVNVDALPHQFVKMTAERYRFTPEEVHVKAGTIVTLEVTALDGTHGIAMKDFGIDVSLPEKHPVEVRFFASEKGEHSFSCSHLCGIGHFWMGGKIIVE